MTFDEYGKPSIFWFVMKSVLMEASSDTFLHVGSIKEPIDTGPRFTQYGTFGI